MFSKEDEYDATHAHAVLWVHLTLVETSLLMYELFVAQRVSPDDKEVSWARPTSSPRACLASRTPDDLPRDYRRFMHLCAAYVASPVLAIGDSARARSTTSLEAAGPLHGHALGNLSLAHLLHAAH